MKKFLAVLLVVLLIAGGLYFRHLQKVEKRNRQYEVSLVKSLKNSYQDIEEIKISNPKYTSIPGVWSYNLVLTFKDGKEVSYRVGHALEDKISHNGSLPGRSKDEKERIWKKLDSKKGKTERVVIVIYSNGEEGKQ